MSLSTIVKFESLDHIKKLIKKQGIPFDAEWTDYESLNTALAYGKKDIAAFLLDQNCRVNRIKRSKFVTELKENTPLHNAVKLRDVQLVKKLLKKKASILATDSGNNSPLHFAFITRQDTIVDLLLDNIQQTSNYINLKNEYGVSHLHIACTRKNVQAIQGFLDVEANIEDVVNTNSPSWGGFAAIHFAVHFKSLEALKILLKLDAKQVKVNTGETPLDLAYKNIEESMIMIDLLKATSSACNAKKKLSYFHLACMNENHAVVERFINHGAMVNSVTPCNLSTGCLSSSLHCAVLSNDKEKVKLLLERGAAIDSINSAQMTPLHLALYNENFLFQETVDIVNMLYANVKDKAINRVDKYGLSYFHVAITRNDVITVRKYLDKGKVDINKSLSPLAENFLNYTPLHLAVWYQYPNMVKLLIEYGADVNANNGDALGTPLHMAFEAGDIDLIELLLKNKAKIDLTVIGEKKTMLHLLVIHCFYEVSSRRGDMLLGKEPEILLYIEHLVKLGINVNAQDKQGNTALHLVDPSREGCAKYFKLLLDLGADINLVNNQDRLAFILKETCADRYKSNEYVIFYDHIQELKNLGLTIHPKNEEFCQKIIDAGHLEKETWAAKRRQRLDEITKLKDIKLDIVTTVFDFLKLDPTRAALFVHCKALKMIAEDLELLDKYPVYGYLIRLQYQRSSKLLNEILAFSDSDGERKFKRQRCE